MNTFLPYATFYESANVLDTKRLRNQLNEYKVIKAALNGAKAWARHPAVLMWQGCQDALDMYAYHIANEMADRDLSIPDWAPHGSYDFNAIYGRPPWFGHPAVHESHRRNLLRKDPSWYGQFFKIETPSDVYAWPTLRDGKWVIRFKQVGATKYLDREEAC